MESDTHKTTLQNSDDEGGRTTIRPPVKITKTPSKPVEILASGVDTLYLSINCFYKHFALFELLTKKKALAVEKDKDIGFLINPEKLAIEYFFNIRPYGAQGYEWLIYNQDFSLRIGNWEKPKARPSIRIIFHSRTLWINGVKKSIVLILRILRELGVIIKDIKISRLDLCVDAFVIEKTWNTKLINTSVTRAKGAALYYFCKKLTGMTFGKGNTLARFYDKALEIENNSKKYWFFDEVWRIDKVPDNYKLIRFEFQLKRETIKELGLTKLGHIYKYLNNVWAYCTQNWIKFQNNPGKQSHQRKTYPWWVTIQNGFTTTNSIKEPLIRCKKSNPKEKDLCAQTLGTMSSLMALLTDQNRSISDLDITIYGTINKFLDTLSDYGKGNKELREGVLNKLAKYQKSEKKLLAATLRRKELGFPVS